MERYFEDNYNSKRIKEQSELDSNLDKISELKNDIKELETKLEDIIINQSDSQHRDQMWLVNEVLKNPENNFITEKIKKKKKKLQEIISSMSK